MALDYEGAVKRLLTANNTVTAVTVVDGAGGVLFQTNNWDITSDIITILNSWRQQQPSIVVQGIKYSTLQCTQERLVATNIMGQGHIVCANFQDQHITIAYVTPDGGAGVAYMDVARANDSIIAGEAPAEAAIPPTAPVVPQAEVAPTYEQTYQQPTQTYETTVQPTTPVPSSSWATTSQDTDMKNLLWELDEFAKFVTRGEFGQFLQNILREGDQVKCWELLKVIRSMKSFMERNP
ncbi:MAG: hypothetical protein HWN67_05405 [Candidatus Helarchaeota archaeon]|nr:hypothetical protein [Candidatus Helarchaeota archaeon]